jgi:UDP-glucose 4-epimerase
VSGVDFKVENAARRPGDPAQLIAASENIRHALDWQPQFDELSMIVAHALAWERALLALNRAGLT